MTTKVEPTVEKWERNRILDMPKLYHSLMALRLERKTLEALSDTINEAISHSIQEAKAEERKRIYNKIELELNRLFDEKTLKEYDLVSDLLASLKQEEEK